MKKAILTTIITGSILLFPGAAYAHNSHPCDCKGPTTTTVPCNTTTTVAETTTVPSTTVPETTVPATTVPEVTTSIATTTIPENTTTQILDTTSSQASTSTTGPVVATTIPSIPPRQLPTTGSNDGPVAFLGFSLLGVGAFLARKFRS